MQPYSAVLRVPLGTQTGIAQHASVTFQFVYEKIRRICARLLGKQFRGIEAACGVAAELGVAYVECLENIVKADIAQRHCQTVGR